MYRTMGFAHATIARRLEELQERLRLEERGQGTVEYIGLVLLMGLVMAFVTSGNHKNVIGTKVVQAVNAALDQVKP